MSDITLNDNPSVPDTGIDPQRLAWGILLLFFAIFCVLCIIGGLGINHFLFHSTIPLRSVVQVGRGTVLVNGQGVFVQREILNADEISMDPQSQATVSFVDSQIDNHLIASITLKSGTSATFFRALRPRFDWSGDNYDIDLRGFQGDIDIRVTKDLQRGFRLSLQTTQDSLVYINGSGRYSISVSSERVRVINLDGNTVLISSDLQYQQIPVGDQGIIRSIDPTRIIVSQAYVDLLEDSTFEDAILEANTSGQIQQASNASWACSNSSTAPAGSYHTELVDGQEVLRLRRAENATSNGETRCIRWFGQGGRDVTEFSYLALRASFNINFQSLIVCGIRGSECPLTLRMDYIDTNGEARRWFHGFYYQLDPQFNYPTRCDSCTQDHDVINEKAWYTYDSGNLFASFPPNELPREIVNVQFYASGHQYDVFLSDVSLFVGQVEGSNTEVSESGDGA